MEPDLRALGAMLQGVRDDIARNEPTRALQKLVTVIRCMDGKQDAARSLLTVIHAIRNDPEHSLSRPLDMTSLTQVLASLQLGASTSDAASSDSVMQEDVVHGSSLDGAPAMLQKMILDARAPLPSAASSGEYWSAHASSLQCPHCGGLIAAGRLEAHLQSWCPRGE